MLNIFNTLTNKVEEFRPISPNSVGMYVCGPTVYGKIHLGNSRSLVFYDTLYRILMSMYEQVTYARNITDVDDKIIEQSKSQNIPICDFVEQKVAEFHEDTKSLLCLDVTVEPRATKYIEQMISCIETLIKKGHAYLSGGDVLFSVESYQKYGALSNRTLCAMISGSRIQVSQSKKCEFDFTLWKRSKLEEIGWDSPFGYGRPGWHIECSVMSHETLGKSFDIHGGGADLQFPHHENEIAQSVCAYDSCQFAKYWVHNGFLTVDGKKMSKSLGNVKYASTFIEQGYSGRTIRAALLSSHYRKPTDFNDHLIKNSQNTIDKFAKSLRLINSSQIKGANPNFKLNILDETCIPKEGREAIFDNINLAKYFALMHKIAKDASSPNTSQAHREVQVNHLWNMGSLLGIFDAEILQ